MSSSGYVDTNHHSVNAARLFLGSCFALIATAVSFAVLADIMGSLKSQFVLTNQDVGNIVGAGTWGFTVSIFVLGPLCDALGMRRLLRFAFLCHVVGPLIMVFATGFWSLFAGALIISLGNGTVEAACNPLVATIYSDRKTQKLNQFHVWFPGGIVIGGLVCFLLGGLGITSWQVRLGVILVPTIIYGILFFGQVIPATERLQSGISFGDMLKAATRPLFIILFFCMMITASLELGPNRWIPSILQAGGIHGILVLVWISGLMAVLRFFAGALVHRLAPTGVLLCSAILAGLGLFWLSFAETTVMAFLAATVFAVGVCYFWPTMLGVVSERVPRTGAFGLALMGGIGMLVVGVVTTPLMGKIADGFLNDKLPAEQTRAVLNQVVATFPDEQSKAKGKQAGDIEHALNVVKEAQPKVQAAGPLPQPETANALRAAVGSGVDSTVVKDVKSVLDPAENYGGRMSFRKVAPFAIILVLVFGVLYARDKARGGYQVEKISG